MANDPESTCQRLLAAARAADPDPWRDALRAKCFSRDAADVEAFRRLADDTKALDAQPTTSPLMLAGLFAFRFGDGARSERILRHAWNRDPGDFWVNFALAFARSKGDGQSGQGGIPTPWQPFVFSRLRSRPDPAVRWLTVLSVKPFRPRGSSMKRSLSSAGLRLKPDYDLAHCASDRPAGRGEGG